MLGLKNQKSFDVQKPPVSAPQISVAQQRLTAHFEYTGKTALTVVSPATGKHYRFAKPGARLEVDMRDRAWLTFVPNLKSIF
ncbi:MAG TPA: hypothetical protein VHA06_06240 [Candidatus Angelobacter sp.]|jgi:hypothetical protein|nr:hypothetical protein [Candidatus Angelobacter sp.]